MGLCYRPKKASNDSWTEVVSAHGTTGSEKRHEYHAAAASGLSPDTEYEYRLFAADDRPNHAPGHCSTMPSIAVCNRCVVNRSTVPLLPGNSAQQA